MFLSRCRKAATGSAALNRCRSYWQRPAFAISAPLHIHVCATHICPFAIVGGNVYSDWNPSNFFVRCESVLCRRWYTRANRRPCVTATKRLDPFGGNVTRIPGVSTTNSSAVKAVMQSVAPGQGARTVGDRSLTWSISETGHQRLTRDWSQDTGKET